jgi:hypothetical protein
VRPEILLGTGNNRVWLSDVAGWGNLHIKTRWGDGGSGPVEATWEMTLPPLYRPRGLTTDIRTEIYVGGEEVFPGRLPDTDWSAGEFSAVGAVREAEEALALNGAGETTATPNTFIDAGISRSALSWVRRVSISAVSVADQDITDELHFIQPVMDAYADGAGLRWGVNARREVFTSADPTVPSWYIIPGAGELGTSTDRMVGKLYGRYVPSSGNPATVTSGVGLPEVPIDLTARGTLSSGSAQTILNGIGSKAIATKNFTNSLEVDSSQIISPGGTPAALHRVRAGQMVRCLALRDERNGLPWTDFVIGDTDWDVDAETIALTPIDAEERDLATFVEEAGGVITR